MTFRFMLAKDLDENKLFFPLIGQPKIDGLRGGRMGEGTGLLARSLNHIPNRHAQELYGSHHMLAGFDGELHVGPANGPDIIQLSNSGLKSADGKPNIHWTVYDLPFMNESPYHLRLKELEARVDLIHTFGPTEIADSISVIPYKELNCLEELLAYEEQCLEDGYEGMIARNPNSLYKYGRATAGKAELLRLKRFVEEEAVVLSIEEGQHNGNAAYTNKRGQTERSTHKENMVGNSMVGALICKDVKTGAILKVAAGRLTHEERRMYFENPEMILGKVIKYKAFARGIKDMLRFPTFQCIRHGFDL